MKPLCPKLSRLRLWYHTPSGLAKGTQTTINFPLRRRANGGAQQPWPFTTLQSTLWENGAIHCLAGLALEALGWLRQEKSFSQRYNQPCGTVEQFIVSACLGWPRQEKGPRSFRARLSVASMLETTKGNICLLTERATEKPCASAAANGCAQKAGPWEPGTGTNPQQG